MQNSHFFDGHVGGGGGQPFGKTATALGGLQLASPGRSNKFSVSVLRKPARRISHCVIIDFRIPVSPLSGRSHAIG